MVEKVEKKAEKVADAAPKAPAKDASITPEYGWAANVVKLNRAKAWVSANQKDVSGKDLENAVKDRYQKIGGLVIGEGPNRVGKGTREVNVADDDGSID